MVEPTQVWREMARRGMAEASRGRFLITYSTFKAMLEEQAVPEDAIGEMFFALDTNTDGVISEKEFADNFGKVGERLCRAMSCDVLKCPDSRESMQRRMTEIMHPPGA